MTNPTTASRSVTTVSSQNSRVLTMSMNPSHTSFGVAVKMRLSHSCSTA